MRFYDGQRMWLQRGDLSTGSRTMQRLRPPGAIQLRLVLHRLPRADGQMAQRNLQPCHSRVGLGFHRVQAENQSTQSLETCGWQISNAVNRKTPPGLGRGFLSPFHLYRAISRSIRHSAVFHPALPVDSLYSIFSRLAISTQMATTSMALRMSATGGKDGAIRILRSRGSFLYG